MTKKERFSRIIESFVNEQRKDSLELFFGTNSKLKIQNIDYSDRLKTIIIEAKVIFGGDFDESFTDFTYFFDEMLGVFIKDAVEYIEPNAKIALTISYDI